jgi:hypothetical protein
VTCVAAAATDTYTCTGFTSGSATVITASATKNGERSAPAPSVEVARAG